MTYKKLESLEEIRRLTFSSHLYPSRFYTLILNLKIFKKEGVNENLSDVSVSLRVNSER